MASSGDSKAFCPGTGLTVPECSCPRCLEEMLHRFRPELLRDEIRIMRTGGRRGGRPDLHRDQPG